MRYEIAKALSNSGFMPKSYVGAKFYRSVASHRKGVLPAHEVVTQVFDDLTFQPPNYIYIPNLEDLVEACGEKFRTLDRDASGGTIVWLCNNYLSESDEGSDEIIVGKSPVEAVAKLWLKLHEK